MQRADLVGNTHHQTRAVVTRRRAACAAEHEETRRVRGIVLDVLLQHAQLVFFRRKDSRDGRRVLFLRRQLRRTRVGRRFNNFHARQMVLNPAAALRERLRMHEQFLNLRARRVAHQTLLHLQNNLRNDLQIAVHEHVERVRDDAFRGIFHRHHAVIRAVLGDLGENVRDGFLRPVAQARTEPLDCRLMRERRLRAEIRDGHGLFERERAGHDFAVDCAQLLVRHRSGVGRADALEHGAFAMRCVNLLARRELDVADGQHVARAFVEQPDDVRIQLVNRLAMFGNVQAKVECRIYNEESNLFRARCPARRNGIKAHADTRISFF